LSLIAYFLASGLFPSHREIKMTCSCPEWAGMRKHVAAVLYGAGARLDIAPELLFTLRGVDRSELIVNADADLPMTRTSVATERILCGGRCRSAVRHRNGTWAFGACSRGNEEERAIRQSRAGSRSDIFRYYAGGRTSRAQEAAD
jgi:uncharacterized Zn finger protein